LELAVVAGGNFLGGECDVILASLGSNRKKRRAGNNKNPAGADAYSSM